MRTRTAVVTTAAVTTGLALALGAAAYATLDPQSQICGPVLIAPPRPGEIALTFDDGPNPSATPQLLDLLARHHVPAAFFVIGAFARHQRPLLRQIAAAGHTVGSHTMTHPWLPWQGDARITRELTDSQRLLEDILGAPIRTFRPPHGARRPFALRLAQTLGMHTVQWNVIAKDWQPDSPETIAARVDTGIRHAFSAGTAANVVLHDGSHLHTSADRSRTLAATELLLNQYPAGSFVPLESWL